MLQSVKEISVSTEVKHRVSLEYYYLQHIIQHYRKVSLVDLFVEEDVVVVEWIGSVEVRCHKEEHDKSGRCSVVKKVVTEVR